VKSAVETLSPTRVRLTVEVPFAELGPAVESAYRRIASQVQLPGFRKGRVPPRLIDQRFGRAVVLEEAVNDALPRFYTQAVQDNSVEALGQPDVDVKEFADGAELKFTAEVDIRPSIELPDFDTLEVTVANADVSDADVDRELRQLRERFSTLVTAARPAQAGDFLQLDLVATIDGEEVEDGRATGLSFEVGSKSLLPGLDEAVVGLSAGDSTTFTTRLVGRHEGQDAEVEVTVKTVRERELPELDDEFAQTASEFDTLEELTTSIRDRLERVKLVEQGAQARDKALEALIAEVDMPIPERLLEQEIQARQDALQQQLSAAGMSKEFFLNSEGRTEEEFDAEIAERTREAIAAQLVLDAIARTEQLSVSESELSDQVLRRAYQARMAPDAFAQQIVEAGEVPNLVSEVVRAKALSKVLEAAKILDESGRQVDMAALNPPSRLGTDLGTDQEDQGDQGDQEDGPEPGGTETEPAAVALAADDETGAPVTAGPGRAASSAPARED
jgi:trigger factor